MAGGKREFRNAWANAREKRQDTFMFRGRMHLTRTGDEAEVYKEEESDYGKYETGEKEKVSESNKRALKDEQDGMNYGHSEPHSKRAAMINETNVSARTAGKNLEKYDWRSRPLPDGASSYRDERGKLRTSDGKRIKE